MKLSRRFLILLFAGLFFTAWRTCYAQIGDTATTVVDTSAMHQPVAGYEEKAETARFDTIHSVDKLSVRVISDSTMARLKRDKDYWYADVAQEKDQKKEETPNANSFLDKDWVRTVLWILVTVVFAAAVIWFLASSNISLFRKKAQSRTADEAAEPDEDIFALAYEKELAAAIAAKQYRPAVRLLYLRTLKDLSEGGMIQYSQDKTNSNYLTQLSGTGYYTRFFNLTRTFEYVWYGRQEPEEEVFRRIQNNFDQFKSSLRS